MESYALPEVPSTPVTNLFVYGVPPDLLLANQPIFIIYMMRKGCVPLLPTLKLFK